MNLFFSLIYFRIFSFSIMFGHFMTRCLHMGIFSSISLNTQEVISVYENSCFSLVVKAFSNYFFDDFSLCYFLFPFNNSYFVNVGATFWFDRLDNYSVLFSITFFPSDFCEVFLNYSIEFFISASIHVFVWVWVPRLLFLILCLFLF